jgi:hypothetical protein
MFPSAFSISSNMIVPKAPMIVRSYTTITLPIFKMEKLTFKEIKWLVQGQPWLSQSWHPTGKAAPAQLVSRLLTSLLFRGDSHTLRPYWSSHLVAGAESLNNVCFMELWLCLWFVIKDIWALLLATPLGRGTGCQPLGWWPHSTHCSPSSTRHAAHSSAASWGGEQHVTFTSAFSQVRDSTLASRTKLLEVNVLQ